MATVIEGNIDTTTWAASPTSHKTFGARILATKGTLTRIRVRYYGRGTSTNKLKVIVIRDNGSTGYTYLGDAYTSAFHNFAWYTKDTSDNGLTWGGAYSSIAVEVGDIVVVSQNVTGAGANQKGLGISTSSTSSFAYSGEVTTDTTYANWGGNSPSGTLGARVELTIETNPVLGGKMFNSPFNEPFNENTL